VGDFMELSVASHDEVGVSWFRSGWMRPLPSRSITSEEYIRSQVGEVLAGMTAR